MGLPAGWKRLLVYGGAFDPPHRAHVELPEEARRAVGAHGVLYVPTGVPPHKAEPETPAEHRLAMLELALRDRPATAISTIELERPGPSYMVDTLVRLREQLGGDAVLRLLIGADMAARFYRWREPRRITELAEPLVLVRPPCGIETILQELPAGLGAEERQAWRRRVVETRCLEISSTELRAALAAGRFDAPVVRDALDPRVLDYIRRHGLYRTPRTD